MIDRQIRDHPFQIGLSPGGKRCKHDRANRQRQQPWAGDLDLVRKKREQNSDETVNAHLRKCAGKDHRHSRWRGFVGVGQPGMKWKKWNLYCQADKNSGECKPGERSGKQWTAFCKIDKLREIECTFRKINSEKAKQHCDTAEKRVQKKLCCGAIA